MKLISRLFIAFLISYSMGGSAKVSSGVYNGTNNLGLKCSIEIMSSSYFPKIKNPLNQTVLVKIHKYGVLPLRHQVMISSDDKSVVPDIQRLVGRIGLKNSAVGIEVKVDHESSTPTEFNIIVHNWKLDKAIMYSCNDLQ